MVKNYHYWNKIKNVDGTLLIYRIPTKLNIVFKQRSETNSI